MSDQQVVLLIGGVVVETGNVSDLEGTIEKITHRIRAMSSDQPQLPFPDGKENLFTPQETINE